MFTRFSVQRLSVGSIYKILFIGLLTTHLSIGLVCGVLALCGFDTVRWENVPVHGAPGLLLGLALSLVMGLFFSFVFGTAAVLGLWLYSKVRPLSLKAKDVAHEAA